MTVLAFLLEPGGEGETVLAIPQHVDVLRQPVQPDWTDMIRRLTAEGYEGDGYIAEDWREVRWYVLLRDETSAVYTRVDEDELRCSHERTHEVKVAASDEPVFVICSDCGERVR